METSTKSRIAISFYETQLVRSQLTNENREILNQLRNHSGLIIFTNADNRDLISRLVAEHQIENCEIIAFKPPNFNSLCQLIVFLLRWSEPSSGTYRLAYREFIAGRISRFGLIARLSLWRLLSRFSSYKRILRKVILYLHAWSTKGSDFEVLPNIDLLILTSITNLDDDIPLGIWYKNQGCVVVGSVRSWDNLVTKGGVALEPDLFLANSEYIRECAIRNQSFNHKNIELVPSSYFQDHLKPFYPTRQSPNIAYACLGPSLNPDEMNLIKLLERLSRILNIHLTVVQHPQFPHILNQETFLHLNFVTFSYSEASLQDFYNEVSKFSLVLGGGTTFLLDAAFLDIPIYAINYEVESQEFWKSSLRAFDVLPHTKAFFKRCQVPIIENERALFDLLVAALNGFKLKEIDKDPLEYFVGSSHMRFAERFSDVIQRNVTTKSFFSQK